MDREDQRENQEEHQAPGSLSEADGLDEDNTESNLLEDKEHSSEEEEGEGRGGSSGMDRGTGSEGRGTASGSRVDRVQEAIRRAEEATYRAEAAERRLREQTSAETARLSQAERQAKLESMTPEERLSFMANEAMARVDFEARKAQFVSQDLADKAEFLNRISTKPNLIALSSTVEQKLADLRKNGSNVTRETMLKYVLGERAYAAAVKGASTKQKNRGAENVARATTSATSAKTSMNGTGKKSSDTARARLEGISF